MEENVIIPQGGVTSTEATSARFVLRQGEVDEWTIAEYSAPLKGEPIIGWENDKPILKIGNGSGKWDELPGLGAEELAEIKKYMDEHGGSWDAIKLEDDNFSFCVNQNLLSHTTGGEAAGFIFTPIYNALGENDKMELPYWGNLAVGKSIRINNTYSSAFGSYHNIEATGAFVTGIHNTILRNKTYTGQYAVVMGQSVGAIGNASFSTGFGPEGACQQFFYTLQNTENPVLLDVWKGVSSDRGKRPAIAVGKYSARFGLNNATLGYASFAAGGYNVANGDYSFTMGENTQSLGKHSCSFGYEVTAEGDGSTGFGKNNQANGSCSFVGGYMNQSLGNYSTAFGQNNKTTSSNSFAVGTSNIASGSSAIAVGNNNLVSNQYSFGAGLANLLVNKQSFALGSGLQSQNTGEVLVGYLNKKVNDAILTVGNGTGNIERCKIVDGKSVDPEGTERSNAFVVYTDGHAEVGAPSTNDLAVATYGQIKTIFDIKTENASGYNEEDSSFIYTAEWTEIYNNDRIIQATALFTITNSLDEEAGPMSLNTFTCSDLSKYNKNLTKAILTYNGSTQDDSACNCCYVYRPMGDENIPIIRFWHESGSLDIEPGQSIKLTLQLSL